jgi:hypothetical protein
MPFTKLVFRPGINRDTTNYANEGGWYECDKVRFYSGYPQKLGGWVEYTPERIIGTCRQLWNWVTSYIDNFLAVGTNQKVYIEAGGIFYDITPLRVTLATPDTDNCVETTDTSTTVNIAVTGHGCQTNDYVTISGVTGDIGGVPDAEINTEHIITRVDADNFTITVTTAATSTASGGGTSIDIACQISPGFPSVTEGYGWGSGAWNGNYGWGLASPTPVFLPQRDWWFDNFDNDLVMNIRADTSAGGVATGGPIYYWERGATVNPTNALETRAVLLSGLTLNGVAASDVPDSAGQILISQNDKHLLAFGCQPYGGSTGDYDPLLIRWASQDQPNVWTPTTINSAGFIRVSRGSRIVRAIPTRQEIITLTDTHVYSLQFLGTIDVFGLQELSDNTSIMSPRSAITANNVLYWMGLDKFYVYDGRVQTLPCTIREYVFKDINFAQADQVICGTNEGFNEIWWFYASGTSDWVDRYVIYNHLDKIWYYGNLGRTAWLDTASRDLPTAVYTPPPSSPPASQLDQDPGIVYTQESGVDAAGLPMAAYIQSSDFDIGDGEQFMLTRRMIPDINFNQSTAEAPEVTLAVRSRNWPGSNFQNDPSDTKAVIETSVGQYTNQVFVRARGRQMALKVASEDLGVQWQLGAVRLDSRPDGKR